MFGMSSRATAIVLIIFAMAGCTIIVSFAPDSPATETQGPTP